MSSAHLLVRLYPAAVRERWGDELEQQLTESGPRSWPDAVRGAAGLWVRPALWPHTAASGKRALSTLAFAVTVATALLLRASGTGVDDVLAVNPIHPFRSAWLALVLLGVLAATPVPRLRVAVLARIALVGVRTLGLPAIALLAMFVAANTGLIGQLDGVPDAVLVTYYWSVLVFAGARGCTLITRIADDTCTPSARRLRAALTLIGSGLALAVCQITAAMARAEADVTRLIVAVALTAFAVIIASAARDLRAVAQ